MSFSLTLADISGDTWSEEITVTRKVLGRDEGCAIRLEHASVSRRHCEFWLEGEVCFVADCGSRNGTYVNGIKIVKERLGVGDTISVGRFELILEFTEIAQRTIEILQEVDFPPPMGDERTEEQHLARIVHRRLNPIRRLNLPGLTAEVLYHPSGELGGDTFESLEFKNRRVLALFDPMTHGVKAAMHSMLVRSELQRWVLLTEEPARCLQRINAELVELRVADLYVHAIVASWFPRTSTLVYATAGGHPPLIMRGRQPLNIDEVAGGVPLGVSINEQYSESIRQLRIGDRVFFFSDGIGEALRDLGEHGLTAQELAARLADNSTLPVAEQIRRVIGIQPNLSPLDDMLLVGAEVVADTPNPA